MHCSRSLQLCIIAHRLEYVWTCIGANLQLQCCDCMYMHCRRLLQLCSISRIGRRIYEHESMLICRCIGVIAPNTASLCMQCRRWVQLCIIAHIDWSIDAHESMLICSRIVCALNNALFHMQYRRLLQLCSIAHIDWSCIHQCRRRSMMPMHVLAACVHVLLYSCTRRSVHWSMMRNPIAECNPHPFF